MKIKCLRLDRGGEFTSNEFNIFYEANGIKRQFSAPRTLEQNGIAERRNRLVIEIIWAMLAKNDVDKIFWREDVNKKVYTMNRVQVEKDTYKAPYELWLGQSPTVKYFKIFGSKCYIKRDDDICKFDARSDEFMHSVRRFTKDY